MSSLIHLIRGGADAEMRWTATAHGDDAYGLLTMEGKPMPAALATSYALDHLDGGSVNKLQDLHAGVVL